MTLSPKSHAVWSALRINDDDDDDDDRNRHAMCGRFLMLIHTYIHTWSDAPLRASWQGNGGLRVPAPRATHPSFLFSLFLMSETLISPEIRVTQINQIDQIGKH